MGRECGFAGMKEENGSCRAERWTQGSSHRPPSLASCSEELGARCEVVSLVVAAVYSVATSLDEHAGVLVLSYLCRPVEWTGEFEFQGEGGPAEFRLTPLVEIPTLVMPGFYRNAIELGWSRGRAYREATPSQSKLPSRL